MTHIKALALTVLLLASCSGQVGQQGEDDPADLDTDPELDEDERPVDDSPGGGAPGKSFACDAATKPTTAPLRRLSKAQFVNTLHDLAALALSSRSEAAAMMRAMDDVINQRPDDLRRRIGLMSEGKASSRLDQVVLPAHVESSLAIAEAFATKLLEGPRFHKVLGTCASDQDTTNDAACVTKFLESWGSRALRRPLSQEDVAFYLRYSLGAPAIERTSMVNIVTGLLTSPRFAYEIEHGDGRDAKADVVDLTAFELAGRLSYQVWDTMPDDDLWKAALDGSLRNPDVFEQQVTRLLADPRGHQTVQGFFRQWLAVDDLPALETNKDLPAYTTFAAGFVPTAGLRSAMIAEVDDVVRATVLERRGTMRDILTTNAIFPRSKDLATIYGTQMWSGAGDPPTSDRRGILTRAALLAGADPETHPILRGVFVRGTVLCDTIPDAPANAQENTPDLDPSMSQRQRVEAITEQPGTACAACHKQLINPIGYVLERYDSLGRSRSEERIIDKTGKLVATKSIDTVVVPAIDEGDETRIDNDRDLMDLIAKSRKVEACAAQQLFRFTFARRESLESDGCALERTRKAFTTGSFQDGWRSVLADKAFRQRTF